MSLFKTVNINQAQQLITEENPVILDCRDVKSYREGHIDNAMHLHEQLRESLLKKGEKDRHFLIYCYHGHASEHVAEMFCDFGFRNVYSLSGGYTDWQAQYNAQI